MTRAFVDSNVIGYAYDRRDPSKQSAAWDVLADRSMDLVVSTQVMVETAAILRRGLPDPVALPVVREILSLFDEMEVVVMDPPLVHAGLAEAERWQLSHWDGLIVAAARQATVDVLLTEDLTDGQDFDGLVVRNPFAEVM